MEQRKFIRKGDSLQPVPTMKAPDVENGDYFLSYAAIKTYEAHVATCEKTNIPMSPELMAQVQEGQVVIEGKDFVFSWPRDTLKTMIDTLAGPQHPFKTVAVTIKEKFPDRIPAALPATFITLKEVVDQYVNKRYNESDNQQYFNERACEKDFAAGIEIGKSFYQQPITLSVTQDVLRNELKTLYNVFCNQMGEADKTYYQTLLAAPETDIVYDLKSQLQSAQEYIAEQKKIIEQLTKSAELAIKQHTEASWILTSESLPPECKVVLGYSDYWIDEDYNPEGIRECFYNDGVWTSAKWNNEQDCYDTEDGTHPIDWMQMPKPPIILKTQENK